MAAISGIETPILPQNFTHWTDFDDFANEFYVFDHGEIKFKTLKLLQGFFVPFLTKNVRHLHKTMDNCSKTFIMNDASIQMKCSSYLHILEITIF